jgi:DnaK suppressor protein
MTITNLSANNSASAIQRDRSRAQGAGGEGVKYILVDPTKPESAARLALLAARADLEHRLREREAIVVERHHDPLDEAVQMVAREQECLIADSATGRLHDIRDALQRLDSGRWGVCEGCGGAIAPARLKALPWAAMCRACQEAAEMAAQESICSDR